MDVFLILNGVVENIVSVPSMEWAISAYQGYQVVERTETNAHLNIGDAA
jgi:hypothetical protein